MKKILSILILFSFISISNAVTVTVNKNIDFSILYFETNIDRDKISYFYDTLLNLKIKDTIRLIKSCDLVYLNSNNICVSLIDDSNGNINLKISTNGTIKQYSYINLNQLKLLNDLYEYTTNNVSPFLSNFVFITDEIIGNKKEFSLFLSNYNGSKITKLFQSPKTIMSLSLNKNFLLAYISFENIYPNIVIHDIKTNKRIILDKINYRINSVKWDLSGENLLISMKEKDFYNIYTLNINTKELKQITNFNYNSINPVDIGNSKIGYTALINEYPSVYVVDTIKRTNKKFALTKNYLYSDELEFFDNQYLSIVKDMTSYSLLLFNNNKNKIKIFSNDYLENPIFIKKTPFLALTFKEKNSNSISIFNFEGKLINNIKFKNLNITDLEAF